MFGSGRKELGPCLLVGMWSIDASEWEPVEG